MRAAVFLTDVSGVIEACGEPAYRLEEATNLPKGWRAALAPNDLRGRHRRSSRARAFER